VAKTLVDRLDAALPQTQCTRCGYPDCRAYAKAMVQGEAGINQCPPGGAEGIARLAALTGRPVVPLDPAHGSESARRTAVIDEDWCIGCTLCIKACPVDCILGASKRMHTVVETWCTGCELCVPACPVDCISMEPTGSAATGWAAWSTELAEAARRRYQDRQQRSARELQAREVRLAAKAASKLADLGAASSIEDPEVLQRKRALIEATLARARARSLDKPGAP
jgi:electron transport complex protein RnfB